MKGNKPRARDPHVAVSLLVLIMPRQTMTVIENWQWVIVYFVVNLYCFALILLFSQRKSGEIKSFPQLLGTRGCGW